MFIIKVVNMLSSQIYSMLDNQTRNHGFDYLSDPYRIKVIFEAENIFPKLCVMKTDRLYST